MAWQMFPMYMHSDDDINQTLRAFRESAEICMKAINNNNIEQCLEGKPVDWIEVL